MKIYAPSYYENFRCIADKCRHSCCIGWRIEVNEDTLDKARASREPVLNELLLCTESSGNENYIDLVSGRCPFLDGKGLCRIISAVGEEFTPDICKEHPRFYNNLGTRFEVGLGLCCEEAARIILSSDDYNSFIQVGEDDTKLSQAPDFVEVRDRLLDQLKNNGYNSAIKSIIKEYRLQKLVNIDFGATYAELEYLDEGNRKVFSCLNTDIITVNEDYLTRFLAYMIYRYLSVAESELELRAALGFAWISTLTFNHIAIINGAIAPEDYYECARIFSSEIEYNENNIDTILFDIECQLLED